MNSQPAPDTIMELLSFTYYKNCVPEKCPCILNGQVCTDMCRLLTCDNRKVDKQPILSDSVDSDSDND